MSAELEEQPAQLLALGGEVAPQTMFLTNSCTIGRSSSCDIVVSGRTVSRIHARIVREGPRYMLLDAGSANGTFVNGTRISEPHLLQNQDALGLGSSAAVLRFLDPDPTYVPGDALQFDERTLRFTLHGEPLELSPIQLRLLAHLLRHAGQLCSRESCATAIWGRAYDHELDAAALDRAVANLRATLRAADASHEYIQTRRGLGYLLDV